MSRIVPYILLALTSASLCAASQTCPTESTDVSASLTGTLEFHPGVYAWYGLRTPTRICGQRVVSIGLGDSAVFRETHRFVGCTVAISGKLMVPDTGYWSTPLGLIEPHIQPEKSCIQGKPLPDYSAISIPSTVENYQVTAIYDPSTYLFSANARDASTGKLLSPWQTYVTDSGNGARDLQRMFCAEGFTASQPKQVTQTQNEPTIDSDMPRAIDVLIADTSVVQVSFVCRRSHSMKAETTR